MNTKPPKLLTPRQAAKYLGVHQRTLSRYVADGRIKKLKYGKARNAKTFYRKDALDAFLVAQEVG